MNKARKVFRRRVARRAPRRMVTKPVSYAVKKYVKRALHTQVENKCVQINSGATFGNVLQDPEMNAFPMAPLSGFWSIAQGVGQGQRIGNQIRTRKAYLNYVLRPVRYDSVYNPFPQPSEVQLMLGYVKNTPAFAPAAPDIQLLFQNGGSTSAPVGSLRDIISVINTDYWVIKKRWTHKIGYAVASGTGTSPNNQSFSNNDFKLNVVKRIDITSYLPKLFQFNDNSISPTTKNLFLMFQAVSSDGGIYSAAVTPTNIEFWVDYHFEDA